jgi:hypothetical protein
VIESDPGIPQESLISAVARLVGQTRAFVHEVEGLRDEIDSQHDERAVPVVDAVRLALTQAAREGTVCHLERTASGVLQRLREDAEG